jgi:hypothetical protein
MTPVKKARFTVVRDNLVATISVVVALGSFLGAFLAIDSRYALAEDFATYKRTTQYQLRQYQQDNRAGVLELRRASLEDKIFEIEAKRGTPAHSQLDEALHSRYVEQLRQIDVQQKLNAGTVPAN